MNSLSNKKKRILVFTALTVAIFSSILFYTFPNWVPYSSSIIPLSHKDTININNAKDSISIANLKIDSAKGDFNPDEVATSNITNISTERIIKRDPQDSSNLYARILMLGDSHLMGQFGEFFQRDLHETGLFDILSISIGGAGSASFTYPMHNNCCGFIIRESIHNEKIGVNKKLRNLEYKNRKTGEVIGKKYNGHLGNILTEINPDIVIVALGSNLTNNHQGLINIIKKNTPNSQIVWVGPMRCKKIGIRVKTIQQAVVKNNIFFVRSDDVVGSDSLNMEHLCGAEAKQWANTIFDRMKPLLDRYSSPLAHTRILQDSLKN